jgi:hypothetical protein
MSRKGKWEMKPGLCPGGEEAKLNRPDPKNTANQAGFFFNGVEMETLF